MPGDEWGFGTGDWKVARTGGLESPPYIARIYMR